MVLFVGAAIFWSAFEQAATSLNLFAQDNTRNSVFGWAFPSSWFQSVNALLIIIFAPIFAWIWMALGKRDPSSPAKFAFGLVVGRPRLRGHGRRGERLGERRPRQPLVAGGDLPAAHHR